MDRIFLLAIAAALSVTGASPVFSIMQVRNAEAASRITSCGDCHDYPPLDAAGGRGVPEGAVMGSHKTHASTTDYALSCTVCHVDPNWTAFNHQDGKIQIAANIRSGSYSKGTAIPRSNTPVLGSCQNTYCHSNGTSAATGTVPSNTSPTWGTGAISCNGCHSYPPAYASGSPKANSHEDHSFAACGVCHANTTTDGSTVNTKNHVNGSYDVASGAGASFTYQYSSGGGVCAQVSCHPNNETRQWGGTGPLPSSWALYFKSNDEDNALEEPMPNGYLLFSGSYQGTTTYSVGATGQPGRRTMSTAAGTMKEGLTQYLAPSGTTAYYRIAQFVSPQFASGITVPIGSRFYVTTGNVKSNSGDTINLKYALYQWKADDTKGALLVEKQDTWNIPTTATDRTADLNSISSITFSPGDRIVCEIELAAYSGGFPGSVTISWGDQAGSPARVDLPMAMQFMPE